jgi:hypothetical protein
MVCHALFFFSAIMLCVFIGIVNFILTKGFAPIFFQLTNNFNMSIVNFVYMSFCRIG